MKTDTRTILVLCFAFLLNKGFCQDGLTKITGYFEGSQDGDLVYILSTKDYQDSVTVKNGEFSFDLTPGDQWETYFLKCPGISNDYMFPLFLREGSTIRFTTNRDLDRPEISGDKDALEQNEYYQSLLKLVRIYAELEKKKELESSLNQSVVNDLKKMEDSLHHFSVNWVKDHPSSPFSAAIIRMYIDKTNILPHVDTVALTCFNLLTPPAKKKNHEAWLLARQFALFNDEYSAIPLGKLAPDFNVFDTTGNPINLSHFKDNWLLIDFWAS